MEELKSTMEETDGKDIFIAAEKVAERRVILENCYQLLKGKENIYD